MYCKVRAEHESAGSRAELEIQVARSQTPQRGFGARPLGCRCITLSGRRHEITIVAINIVYCIASFAGQVAHAMTDLLKLAQVKVVLTIQWF